MNIKHILYSDTSDVVQKLAMMPDIGWERFSLNLEDCDQWCDGAKITIIGQDFDVVFDDNEDIIINKKMGNVSEHNDIVANTVHFYKTGKSSHVTLSGYNDDVQKLRQVLETINGLILNNNIPGFDLFKSRLSVLTEEQDNSTNNNQKENVMSAPASKDLTLESSSCAKDFIKAALHLNKAGYKTHLNDLLNTIDPKRIQHDLPIGGVNFFKGSDDDTLSFIRDVDLVEFNLTFKEWQILYTVLMSVHSYYATLHLKEEIKLFTLINNKVGVIPKDIAFLLYPSFKNVEGWE